MLKRASRILVVRRPGGVAGRTILQCVADIRVAHIAAADADDPRCFAVRDAQGAEDVTDGPAFASLHRAAVSETGSIHSRIPFGWVAFNPSDALLINYPAVQHRLNAEWELCANVMGIVLRES